MSVYRCVRYIHMCVCVCIYIYIYIYIYIKVHDRCLVSCQQAPLIALSGFVCECGCVCVSQ